MYPRLWCREVGHQHGFRRGIEKAPPSCSESKQPARVRRRPRCPAEFFTHRAVPSEQIPAYSSQQRPKCRSRRGEEMLPGQAGTTLENGTGWISRKHRFRADRSACEQDEHRGPVVGDGDQGDSGSSGPRVRARRFGSRRTERHGLRSRFWAISPPWCGQPSCCPPSPGSWREWCRRGA